MKPITRRTFAPSDSFSINDFSKIYLGRLNNQMHGGVRNQVQQAAKIYRIPTIARKPQERTEPLRSITPNPSPQNVKKPSLCLRPVSVV